MKSTINEKKVVEEKQSYPCLKIYAADKDFVVLFDRPSTGTIIWDTRICPKLGDHSELWLENKFVLFEGSITLSN